MTDEICPAARAGVAGGDRGYGQRPWDSEIGVVVHNTQVFGGVVGPVDAVTHICGCAERLKPVEESRRNVEVPIVDVVEDECLHSSPGGRLPSDIDQDVEDRAVGATHQLGFASPRTPVETANDALRRTRLRILYERRRQARPTEMVFEDFRVECPGEQAAFVAERRRAEEQNSVEFSFVDTHELMLT